MTLSSLCILFLFTCATLEFRDIWNGWASGLERIKIPLCFAASWAGHVYIYYHESRVAVRNVQSDF
jgi:hypothetical protein